MYAGNKLTDPILNIRAIQHYNTIEFSENTSQFNNSQNLKSIYSGTKKLIVGIKVDGTISQPDIHFFSEPPGLDQSDILSYLIFGVPRSQISSTNSLALLNDILGSSTNQNSKFNLNKITSKIKSNLHLSEFGLGSTPIFDPTKNSSSQATTFNIGRKFGKNLSIHYKTGVSTPFSVLSIQYKINKRLTLQTEASSVESAADLLYEIDID